MVPRRLVVLGLQGLVLAVPFPARAQAPVPTGDVAAPIAALNAALLANMQAGRAVPFASRAAALRPAVERAFDLPAILAASVGARFAGFSEAAKAGLLAAFIDFTVATWTANFDALNGERFEIAPETRPVGSDLVVTVRIVPRTGEATRLDYVMRQAPGAAAGRWRAVDILVNGAISRVAVQRSDFRALLAGGDPAPLVASLRERTAGLAAGSRP